jgi:hypothetical protein
MILNKTLLTVRINFDSPRFGNSRANGTRIPSTRADTLAGSRPDDTCNQSRR